MVQPGLRTDPSGWRRHRRRFHVSNKWSPSRNPGVPQPDRKSPARDGPDMAAGKRAARDPRLGDCMSARPGRGGRTFLRNEFCRPSGAQTGVLRRKPVCRSIRFQQGSGLIDEALSEHRAFTRVPAGGRDLLSRRPGARTDRQRCGCRLGGIALRDHLQRYRCGSRAVRAAADVHGNRSGLSEPDCGEIT